MITKHAAAPAFAFMLALCACSPAAVGSNPPESEGASATASTAVPPSTSASASASASCVDPDALGMLRDNFGTLESLSAEQRDEIATALEAYDFGTNETALAWRDTVVDALEAGQFPNQPTRDQVIVQFNGGMVHIEACP